MDGIALLGSDDLHTLSAAMSAQKKTALTWTLGDAVVTVCVKPAPPVWGAPMIVQVRVERPGVLWWQCFASVEEMRGRWGERGISTEIAEAERAAEVKSQSAGGAVRA